MANDIATVTVPRELLLTVLAAAETAMFIADSGDRLWGTPDAVALNDANIKRLYELRRLAGMENDHG